MKTVSFSLTIAFLLSLSSAHAESLLSEITPTRPKAAGFIFNIRHDSLEDGSVSFRIVVTEDSAKFSSNPTVAISTVEVTDHSQSIHPLRQLVAERDGHSVVCTFSVREAELAQPDLCFVLTNIAEQTVDGKLVQMPSADFMYSRLKEFAGTQPSTKGQWLNSFAPIAAIAVLGCWLWLYLRQTRKSPQ